MNTNDHQYKDQKSIYDDAANVRTDKHAGYWLEDGKVVANTLQCPHCGCHWVTRKDSGIVRGWCGIEMRPTCGSQACQPCVPLEKKIAAIEASARSRRSMGL